MDPDLEIEEYIQYQKQEALRDYMEYCHMQQQLAEEEFERNLEEEKQYWEWMDHNQS